MYKFIIMKDIIKKIILENVINTRTKSNIWYHGSDSPDLTIKNIKINHKSDKMFYGDGFYVASDINLSKKYGKYVYSVEFDGNFFNVISREIIGTYGIFNQYLETIKHSYEENILDYIEDEGFEYWGKKLKLNKKDLKLFYDENDSYYLSERFIEVNIKKLFNEYLENQIALREEYEEEGYNGLMDLTQAVIFNPQKSIKKIELLTK